MHKVVRTVSVVTCAMVVYITCIKSKIRVSDDTARISTNPSYHLFRDTENVRKLKQESRTTTDDDDDPEEGKLQRKKNLAVPCPPWVRSVRWPTWEEHEKRVLQINNQLLQQPQQQQQHKQKEVFPARDKPNLQNLFAEERSSAVGGLVGIIPFLRRRRSFGFWSTSRTTG